MLSAEESTRRFRITKFKEIEAGLERVKVLLRTRTEDTSDLTREVNRMADALKALAKIL